MTTGRRTRTCSRRRSRTCTRSCRPWTADTKLNRNCPAAVLPNLNLIERLGEFTKKKALRGKHYPDFATFRGAIDDCLTRVRTDHSEALTSLMTLKFQTFDNASFLAA